ncbi:Lzipper-MIP1 domain-containing [Salix suchowensis]|nr:Lzipper-MIP1 domain-containing [Salix suchowensis]
MEVRVSRHRHSNSDPFQRKLDVAKQEPNNIFEDFRHLKSKKMGQLEDCVEVKKRQFPNTEVQNSLKQEILDLQDRLQDQVLVRRALEKALLPAKDLMKEIAVLELEVVYMERYLLSLYRKTLDHQIQMSSDAHRGMFPSVPRNDIVSVKDNSSDNASHITSLTKECNGSWGLEKMLDSSIHQCPSSISQRSIGTYPPTRSIARAIDSYHSLPLSMLEQAWNDTSNAITLADHLGTSTHYDVLETPNWLSEEMIRRISAIYCELADPPLINPDYASSPISPPVWNLSSFNSSLDNPFHIGASKEFSGPYCSMAKVQRICRDSQKLRDIQHKLQDFRSLVSRLEGVNPRKMKHEEKLAFWINVHNALVMHAYLVYGIPQNNMKRMSLILKAAYNVGGHTVNVDMIQSSILGCRLFRPGQWLWQLLSSKTKFKVRVYTPKRVFEDLEAAKEEYIQSTIIVQKEKKLHIPKIVDSFAKDLELCPAGVVEMIEHLLPNGLRKRIQQCRYRKYGKNIEWIPHNFAFRYLLSKELA